MNDLTRRIRALERAVIETGEDEIHVYLIDDDGVPYHLDAQGGRVPLSPEELERWRNSPGTIIRVRYKDPD